MPVERLVHAVRLVLQAGALDTIPTMVVTPRAVVPDVVPTLEEHRAELGG